MNEVKKRTRKGESIKDRSLEGAVLCPGHLVCRPETTIKIGSRRTVAPCGTHNMLEVRTITAIAAFH